MEKKMESIMMGNIKLLGLGDEVMVQLSSLKDLNISEPVVANNRSLACGT